MDQQTNRSERKLQRLFRDVLPKLLSKHTSRWTKQEVWNAVELHFKKPNDSGLIHRSGYQALEAKLKAGPVMARHPLLLPEKRGRPRLFTDEEYRKQLDAFESTRQFIASHLGIEIKKVSQKRVGWYMAKQALAKQGLNWPKHKVMKYSDELANHFKALNKKKRLGEI